MWKKVVASLFLLGLISFGIYSSITEERVSSENTKENKGTGITAPNAPSGLKVGEAAPDITLQTLEGHTVSLSELKGKKVFINFWATWCPPCREEMPEMQKFHEKFGDEVEILAVNGTAGEKSVEEVQEYVRKGGYTFPILLDRKLTWTHAYQVISIPTTYFIGTDGVIQQPRKVGPMSYEFMVEMKNKLN